MDSQGSYRVPLFALVKFLEEIYGNEKAFVNIELGGDGFIFYLGKDLPGAGIVDSISIYLPSGMGVEELKPLLKERDINEY